MNEADTCRKFVVPLLHAAGWDNDPHSIAEQRYFTRGRIVVRGNQAERRRFGGIDELRSAMNQLKSLLYATSN